MPFFIRNKNKGRSAGNAKKKQQRKGGGSALDSEEPKIKKQKRGSDEEIPSDDEIDSGAEDNRKADVNYSSSEEEEETAQEKRLRLAKQYLAQIEEEENERADREEFENDPIGHRLKQDLLEQAGKLHKEVATTLIVPSEADIRTFKGHKLPLTCLVIAPNDRHVFSAGKDCSIIKWDLSTNQKVKVIHGGRKGTETKHIGHTAHILCMAISSDGKYLASGDRNKLIHIWDATSLEFLHTFTGHRDAVSGLAFRKGTHQLFSAAHDRTVKLWNVDEMAYVETLFGHMDEITAIDSLTRERAVTSGGRDGSVRIWKIIEESQLVFHGHSGSVDSVALINEEHFVSGADDNSVAVWGVLKKKPLACVKNAHSGAGAPSGAGENWITAVASLQYTDVIASGSKDGCIRLWQCSSDFKSLNLLFQIPVHGFVNGIKFSSDGSFMVAAVGQEHRLGRWWRIKEAKNALYVIKLNRKS